LGDEKPIVIIRKYRMLPMKCSRLKREKVQVGRYQERKSKEGIPPLHLGNDAI